MLLLEGTVRALAPAFSIFETLSRHAAAGSLRQAPQPEASKRLAFEMGSAASDLPALVAQRTARRLARAAPVRDRDRARRAAAGRRRPRQPAALRSRS
jgi:hypothetical protein